MALVLNVLEGRSLYIGKDIQLTVVYADFGECEVEAVVQKLEGQLVGPRVKLREGEMFYVTQPIAITILKARHREARLGIEAPRRIVVSRDDFTLESHLERQGQVDARGKLVSEPRNRPAWPPR